MNWKKTAAWLLITLLIAACLPGITWAEQKPEVTLPPLGENVAAYDPENPGALTADQLYAESCILMNQDDGRVLFEKNADAQMNPASCTKIMTLLLAAEYGNLYEIVRIPESAADIPQDSSKIPVTVGEEMTFQDLLYGFMLRSGNDGANAIATIVSGSVDAFVARMNERAQELGLTNTHYMNAHGYTQEGHYTTARDMALLTKYAMGNATFRKVVGAGQYTMAASNLRGEYTVENSNDLVVYGSKNRYRYATGVKTGTTSAAGQCLVSSATKNGVNLVAVCFKSTVAFKDAKFQDSIRLLEYGFSRYHEYSFQDLYSMLGLTLPISDAAVDDPSGGVIGLSAMLNRTGDYTVRIFDGDLDEYLKKFEENLTIEYTHSLRAPIEEGTVIGNLTFTPDDGEVLTALLVSDRAVTAKPSVFSPSLPSADEIWQKIPLWLKVILGFILLFVLILLLASAAERRRRKRMRRKRRASRPRR